MTTVPNVPPPPPEVLSPDPRTPVTLSSDPLELARKFLTTQHATPQGSPTLRWWRDEFYRFTATGIWKPLEVTAIHNQIWHYLERERAMGIEPSDRKANEVLKAVKGLMLLDPSVDAPCWHLTPEPLEHTLILCRNGILMPELLGTSLEPHALQPHTPELFTLAGLPVDYDPAAPEPVQWLKFLTQLWEDDPASTETLQEIFGLLLVDDMRFDKIFLFVGPARSGKGTILRVIKALLGADTIAAPTLNSLGGEFGMQNLIGKLAALIGDARSGRGEKQIIGTERLLTISGGDGVDVNRKNLSFWSGRLAVRFVLASNELPEFADAAGVIATRFIVLRLTRSFLGREDTRLIERLRPELPGILNWALVGLKRLYARGHFVQPASALEDIEQIRDLASPVAAFVREHCTLGAEATVDKVELYRAWKTYCIDVNHPPGSREKFSKDLYAAVPEVRSIRPRTDGSDRPYLYAGIALKAPPPVAASVTTAAHLHRDVPPPPPSGVAIISSEQQRKLAELLNPLVPEAVYK